MYYLDIPLTALYKFDLGNIGIYAKGGFNIGLGLSGKYKYETIDPISGDKVDESESVEWGGNDGLKRMELGFIIGGGVELNEKMQLGLAFNLGLNDLAPSGGDYKNRVFAISFTYFFTEL